MLTGAETECLDRLGFDVGSIKIEIDGNLIEFGTDKHNNKCKYFIETGKYVDGFNEAVYDSYAVQARNICYRPCTAVRDLPKNVEKTTEQTIFYGEYPQSVAHKDVYDKLEKLYKLGALIESGKTYTTQGNKCYYAYGEWNHEKFEEKLNREYVYGGKKYVRMEANLPVRDSDMRTLRLTLSDGRVIEDGEPVWVEVQPIEWFIDDNTETMFTKNGVFSGVGYDNSNPKSNDFKGTTCCDFLERFFEKDIVPSELTKYINRYSVNGVCIEKKIRE